MNQIEILPAVNATLNAVAAILLLLGWAQIKLRRERAHKILMLSAFVVSIVFLACYLAHHYTLQTYYDSPGVPFIGPPGVRTVYLAILISHVALAATVPVLYWTGRLCLSRSASLGAALLLNRGIRALPLFRTLYYLPAIVPVVSTAVLWKWVFHTEFGLLNSLLAGIGLPRIPWLGSTEWAMPALIIMSWWGFGVSMVILLAGLQGVPEHLLEAARIDGANAWTEFRYVVVPMISPVIFFVMIVQVIGSFQVFTPSFIMTEGGPGNATLTLVLYLYRNGFTYFKMGYASAIAWVLFVIVLLATLAQLRIARSWVYYEGDSKPAGGQE